MAQVDNLQPPFCAHENNDLFLNAAKYSFKAWPFATRDKNVLGVKSNQACDMTVLQK